MSDQTRFEHELMKAKTMLNVDSDNIDYWRGYFIGLLKAHYGEKFCTTEEHEKWLLLADDPDESRQQMGKGYLEGFVALGTKNK